MSNRLVVAILILSAAVSAQIFFSNDVMFDYPEEEPVVNYAPYFDDYPAVLPEYRAFNLPPQSYSRQMWNGCGCASAKTYGDYIKARPKALRSRNHDERLYSFYQMM
uniref:Uncharacterized protein n=1 Tax=Caenorhabditis japonica TaxID=281687 RepID=A0A8R1IAR6_CAEJA